MPTLTVAPASDQCVPSAVIAGLDPAIHHLRENFLAEKMDARVKSAFTRVFDALLPAHDQSRAERITR
jgi:hypothetical protein